MFDYKVIFSDRKSAEIQVKLDGSVTVRMPKRATKRDADKFVKANEKKIEASLEKMARLRENAPKEPTPEEIEAYRRRAEEYLPPRTDYFAALMGVRHTGVKITSAQKRFGSCSAKNSICYSWTVMQYPDELIDYVIVHELAHIKHKNHSKEFYAFIARFLPDYRERHKRLKLPSEKRNGQEG